MKMNCRRQRKAISPVLATVILIAITLIAAVAIAGFVFGLFGTFTSTARIQASVTACNYNTLVAGAEACQLILTNSGNANAATTAACSLTYGGATHAGVVGGGGTVTAGSTLTVTCAYTVGATATVGSQITGSVILSNGGNALFSGTAS